MRKRALVQKFFADRGTHLAAMVAYFALLSFVPLIFLALALFGLAHRADASDFFVKELKQTFPGVSPRSILKLVHHVQDNATVLGVIGGVGLLWSSLSLFSALESALNIVYGLPNRPFIRQKLVVLSLTAAGLAVLFVALVIGSVGGSLAQDAGVAGGILGWVWGIALSTALVFGVVWSIYTLLTNIRIGWRETLPGAVVAALLLEGSFQVLPVFVRATQDLVTLQAFGSLALLLVWIYVMANVLVLGAEVNWYLARGR